MKKAVKKATPPTRTTFPNGSYLHGRLASPKVRAHLSSQQPARYSKTASGIADRNNPEVQA